MADEPRIYTEIESRKLPELPHARRLGQGEIATAFLIGARVEQHLLAERAALAAGHAFPGDYGVEDARRGRDRKYLPFGVPGEHRPLRIARRGIETVAPHATRGQIHAEKTEERGRNVRERRRTRDSGSRRQQRRIEDPGHALTELREPVQ